MKESRTELPKSHRFMAWILELKNGRKRRTRAVRRRCVWNICRYVEKKKKRYRERYLETGLQSGLTKRPTKRRRDAENLEVENKKKERDSPNLFIQYRERLDLPTWQ